MTTRDMARDYEVVFNNLNLPKVNVLGISQGGMIAQFLAIDYPDRVKKLVLAVTASRPNSLSTSNIELWQKLAKQDDFESLFKDINEKSFSEKRLRRYRPFYPLFGKIGKPKSYDRFLIQASSCKAHDAHGKLSKITCPTLVIGGEQDKTLSSQASYELAEQIKGSQLIMHQDLGHGLYEESSEFKQQVLNFFEE